MIIKLILTIAIILAWAFPAHSGGIMMMGGGTPAAAGDTSMYISTGTYTGNATDNRTITGVGFTPQMVIVTNNGTYGAAIKIYNMGSSATAAHSGVGSVNGIKSVASDSFTLGTDNYVNANGTTYYWVAFARNSDADFYCGTYTGNSTDNRDFSDASMGFTPDFVLTTSCGADDSTRWTFQTGDNSFIGNGGPYADAIQALSSNGFQLGTQGYVNNNTTAYYYCAFKAGNNLKISSYTGDGNDNRNITGIGWTPVWVMLKRADDRYYFSKNSTTSATDSAEHWIGATPETNVIQNLNSDGFQVGSSDRANSSTNVFYYMVAKEHKP